MAAEVHRNQVGGPRRIAVYAAVVLILLGFSVTAIHNRLQSGDQERSLAVRTHAALWLVISLEREYLKVYYLSRLYQLTPADEILEELVIQYEVLWSRIDLLKSKEADPLKGLVDYPQTTELLYRTMKSLDRSFEQLKYSGGPLPQAALEELASLSQPIHMLAIKVHNEELWRREYVNRQLSNSQYGLIYSIFGVVCSSLILLFLLFRQLSLRKHLIEELDDALGAAEHANLAKSQFLSRMSHELRTPLNAIIGLAQLFEYKIDLPIEHKKNAREIYKAGEHLLSLINDVLDLSRIESGHMELSMESVSLRRIMDECRIVLSPLAKSRGVTLDFMQPGCDKLYIHADYTRVKQVLLNLLSNAVKYNREDGYVFISCSMKGSDSIRISVEDSGIGISAGDMDRLFEPFNRLNAEFRNIEGTGIGLVITRDLVEMMQGRIGVKSIPGKGSTFWVEFEVAQSVEVDDTDYEIQVVSAAARSAVGSEPRILVAEDNLANQAVLQQQMELLGLAVDFAENGIAAWELLQRGRYDLLLTDISMPLMDGYKLVAKIRETERRTGEHLPVIALTANAMADDHRLCLDNGMDGFITKPVSLDILRREMEKWLPRGDSVDSTISGVEASELSPVNAVDIASLARLVGDDRRKHCKLLHKFLETTPGIIRDIRSGYEKRDAETIRQQSHKLKSSARSMGAHELADACETLEAAGGSGGWDEIDALAPRLDAMLWHVDRYVGHYCNCDKGGAIAINGRGAPPNLLLLDDDPLMLDLETAMLADLGIDNVHTATNGEDALAIVGDQDHAIDIILCDLFMPGMDGVEFLRHLAERKTRAAIVIVSGQDKGVLKTAKDFARELDLHVLDVLEKPVSPIVLRRFLVTYGECPTLEAKPVRRSQPAVTADELRRGIIDDQLLAFYQPKVNAVTREVVGMETLVRWQHPERGLITPDRFVSMAEENGLIDGLTQTVFKIAMRDTAALQTLGFQLNVAINISVDNLNDLSWPDYAVAQAVEAGVDPATITLEITESRLMDNLASALEILTRLRMRDFKLSVDDFGTGYSSMEQLRRAPFSELKIDRAFVNSANNDKSALAILEASIDLAKKLDLIIVAEGIETRQDWDLVASLGCDQVQGFFIAKPMPLKEFETWLVDWGSKGNGAKNLRGGRDLNLNQSAS